MNEKVCKALLAEHKAVMAHLKEWDAYALSDNHERSSLWGATITSRTEMRGRHNKAEKGLRAK